VRFVSHKYEIDSVVTAAYSTNLSAILIT
jgi:hypothetical protein